MLLLLGIDRVNLENQRILLEEPAPAMPAFERTRSLESADKFAPDLKSGRRLHRFTQGTVFSDRPQETRGYIIIRVGLPAMGYTRHSARLLASSCRSSPAGSTRLFHAAEIPRTRRAAPVSDQVLSLP